METTSVETVRAAEGLAAAVCPQCQTINWWLDESPIDQWDGTTIGFGRATVVDRLAAVAAPGPEVIVCRAPLGTRLAWLPSERWVEAAPGLFVAREGRRLLVSSPNPALTEALTCRTTRWARRPRLVQV